MKYFIWHKKQPQGPFDENAILDLLRQGSVTRQTLLSPEGSQGVWVAVEDVFPAGSKPGASATGQSQPSAPTQDNTGDPTGIDLPPVIPPPSVPAQQQPNWIGSPNAVAELRLASGATMRIKEVYLYNQRKLEVLERGKQEAMRLLGGVSSPYSPIGDPMWVVLASTMNRLIEQRESKKSVAEGQTMLAELARLDRVIHEYAGCFPLGQVEQIDRPFPSLWRVPLSDQAYIHNGSDFVSLKDEAGLSFAIRWGLVESYRYLDAP